MDEPKPDDGPQHTPNAGPPAYVALSEITAKLASMRIHRADEFAATFARISGGKWRSINILARFSGIPERRLRELRMGERPAIGELDILEGLAQAIDRGATIEDASEGICRSVIPDLLKPFRVPD